MSFFDDASLVFLPSGQAGKDGKAYSMKPTNGDGDFTFSRGSNLTATRIDSNGLIEKGRENLLLQSNQFDTTWTTSNTSVTSGQSGYDGSSDAWLLENTLTSFPRVEQSVSQSGVVTYSVYAKAGTNNIVRLIQIGGSNAQAYFNLSDGTIANESNVINAQIESVGNSWYRCSITFDGSTTAVRIYSADGVGSFALGNIYIQDAQLEIGLTSTEYIESGASTGLAGILEDSPRFDYSGGASCPSLLLEPSRTQLIPYSEYLSGLSLANSPTITQNYAVSPEGVQNAVRIQDTDGSNFKTIQTQFSITAGSTYTISVYIKKASSPISTYGGFYFDFDGGTRKTSNLIFDEYNGTLVNASGNAITSVIHPVIDEGDYWRFSATATDTGSNTLLRPTLRAGASANGTSLGLAIKDYIAYGFQLEQGSYPTSYIPNHSGGSVTREADSCSDAGTSSTFNDTEGVLYAEIAYIADDQISKVISLSNGTFDERVLISTYSGGSNQVRVFIKSGGSFSATITTTLTDITDFNKIAFRYKSGETKLFVNGSLISTSTDTFSIRGLNALQFASGTATASPFYGKAQQVIVFNTALSDPEMISLTS